MRISLYRLNAMLTLSLLVMLENNHRNQMSYTVKVEVGRWLLMPRRLYRRRCHIQKAVTALCRCPEQPTSVFTGSKVTFFAMHLTSSRQPRRDWKTGETAHSYT